LVSLVSHTVRHMKPRTNPSYLYLSRHGIYYFRYRIPLEVKALYGIQKNEVRKSLRTSNYSDALKKARRLWLEHVDAYDQNQKNDSMIGLPKDKFDLILYLPTAVDLMREYYGGSHDNSLVPQMSHYLSKLGDDPDVLSTFIELLTLEEKNQLSGYGPFKRATLILEFADNHEANLTAASNKTIPNANALTSSTTPEIHELQSSLNEIKDTLADDGLKKITIAKAVKTYLQWYIDDQKENKNKKVPPKTKDDKERTLKSFSVILGGNRLLKSLNQAIIENEYVAKVKRIPQRLANIYPKPRGRKNFEILADHLDEIIKIGTTEARKSKSNDTLNREFVSIKMFLTWAEERFYVSKGLGNFIPSMSAGKDKKAADPSFTENDLALLFNSKHYTQGRLKKPSDYWMPLLGLFTGARGNELAYLFKEDIRKHPDEGIWYIYIRTNPAIAKRAKNLNSIRSIPVHPLLRKLGFLTYIESLKDGSRIFPDLSETKNNRGDFYQKWGNRFNKHDIVKKNGKPVINKNGTTRYARGYMTQCGVKKHVKIEDAEATKSFKSFRHMMVNYLDKNTNPRVKNFIIGHKQENQSVENYIHPNASDLREAFKVLQKLKFSTIDFSKIKKMEWSEAARGYEK